MIGARLARKGAPQSGQLRWPGSAKEARIMPRYEVTGEQASALADLQFHWDEKYLITLEEGTWSARWRDTGERLTGESEDELRQLIRSDYARRQRADYIGLQERMST
jgi:hypothetical protein